MSEHDFEDRLARALAGAVNQTLIRNRVVHRVEWTLNLGFDTSEGRTEIDLHETLDEFEPTTPEG